MDIQLSEKEMEDLAIGKTVKYFNPFGGHQATIFPGKRISVTKPTNQRNAFLKQLNDIHAIIYGSKVMEEL